MNWNAIITGCLFLVLAGLTGADYISTTITTDGTSLLATQGNNDNGTYASRIMTVDASSVSRSLSGGESLESDVSVKSTGPVLISDYASGAKYTIPDNIRCVFSDWMEKQGQESELYSAGILSKGSYTASWVAGSGLTGGTEINGTGMMSFGSQTIGNDSMRSYGFVAGNMTVRDFVKYGGKL
jgi:hypothetical protein